MRRGICSIVFEYSNTELQRSVFYSEIYTDGAEHWKEAHFAKKPLSYG